MPQRSIAASTSPERREPAFARRPPEWSASPEPFPVAGGRSPWKRGTATPSHWFTSGRSPSRGRRSSRKARQWGRSARRETSNTGSPTSISASESRRTRTGTSTRSGFSQAACPFHLHPLRHRPSRLRRLPRWTRRSRPYPRPLLQRPRRRLRRRRRRLPLLRHRPRRLRRRLLRLRSPAQSVRRLHATGPSREQPSLSPPPASPLQNGAPACESRSRPTDPSVLLRRALLTCLPSPAGVRRSALPWLRAHSWAIRGWVARPTPGRPTIRAARSSGSL